MACELLTLTQVQGWGLQSGYVSHFVLAMTHAFIAQVAH